MKRQEGVEEASGVCCDAARRSAPFARCDTRHSGCCRRRRAVPCRAPRPPPRPAPPRRASLAA